VVGAFTRNLVQSQHMIRPGSRSLDTCDVWYIQNWIPVPQNCTVEEYCWFAENGFEEGWQVCSLFFNLTNFQEKVCKLARAKRIANNSNTSTCIGNFFEILQSLLYRYLLFTQYRRLQYIFGLF
jgi:hypothetical protein